MSTHILLSVHKPVPSLSITFSISCQFHILFGTSSWGQPKYNLLNKLVINAQAHIFWSYQNIYCLIYIFPFKKTGDPISEGFYSNSFPKI